MSDEQPKTEGSEPITIRVRDQVRRLTALVFLNILLGYLPL